MNSVSSRTQWVRQVVLISVFSKGWEHNSLWIYFLPYQNVVLSLLHPPIHPFSQHPSTYLPTLHLSTHSSLHLPNRLAIHPLFAHLIFFLDWSPFGAPLSATVSTRSLLHDLFLLLWYNCSVYACSRPLKFSISRCRASENPISYDGDSSVKLHTGIHTCIYVYTQYIYYSISHTQTHTHTHGALPDRFIFGSQHGGTNRGVSWLGDQKCLPSSHWFAVNWLDQSIKARRSLTKVNFLPQLPNAHVRTDTFHQPTSLRKKNKKAKNKIETKIEIVDGTTLPV